MTYKQAYDKIINAYFKNEIKPMRSRFCFCGNLCDKDSEWNWSSDYEQIFGYTPHEFKRMEKALFDGMERIHDDGAEIDELDALYEEALFEGMSDAIEVLKQIHIERGENVDEIPQFTKRELVK